MLCGADGVRPECCYGLHTGEGVRADCMPGFLYLLSSFSGMGRPAGGLGRVGKWGDKRRQHHGKQCDQAML